MPLFYTSVFLLLCMFDARYAQDIAPYGLCPTPELIQPCTCVESFRRTSLELNGPRKQSIFVDCIGIHQPEVIRNVFNNVSFWKFHQIRFTNCTMSYIPSSIFQRAQFSSIYINGTTLVRLFDEPPEAPHLKEVFVEGSSFRAAQRWELFSNTSLRELMFKDTTLRRISSSFGQRMPQSLMIIWLINTGLTSVSKSALSNLRQLKSVHIQYQNMKILPSFSLPATVIDLDLRFNQIESLPADFDVQYRHVDMIDLSYNFITVIGREGHIDLPKYHSRFFAGNPLDCSCHFKWFLEVKDKHIFGTCATPTELKSKLIQDLTPDDFGYCMD